MRVHSLNAPVMVVLEGESDPLVIAMRELKEREDSSDCATVHARQDIRRLACEGLDCRVI